MLQELTADKLTSEADLQRTLGTLRYLRSLKEARRKAADDVSADASSSAATAAAEDAGGETCPVCHEPLGSELVMLPCAHTLCCKCSMTLVEQQRRFSPQVLLRHGLQIGKKNSVLVENCRTGSLDIWTLMACD